MGVVYIKTDQGSQITSGTGAPTHTAVAGDRYTDTATGNTYQYTTSWQMVAYGGGSSVNIYNTDGTLTADRIVDISNKNLFFNGVGNTVKFFQSDGAQNTLIEQTLYQIRTEVDDGTFDHGKINVALNLLTLSAQTGTYISTQTQTASSITNKISSIIAGVTYFQTTMTSNGLRINNAYTLPKVDGTANQVLTTNGFGNVTWGAVGGLTYFTEAQNTTAPNATVPVDSLLAVTATTNGDIAIVPKGTGAFTLAVPDNTTVGGNKRGANAVDLQTIRTNATQVASGQYSFASGRLNTASGEQALACGYNNSATNTTSVAIGQGNTSSNDTTVAIGISNTASGYRSASIGTLNSATGTYSIAFGFGNTSSRSSAVAIGNNNTAGGDNSIAIGSNVNTFLQHGRISFSSGLISSAGDIQKSFYILKGRTTDATPKTLTSDNGGVTTASILVLQNNNVIRFKGSIVGKQTGTTNVGVWDIDGVIVRGANASATTLTISNINIVTNASAWGTPTLTADTTLGGLTLNAVGLAGTNIQWIASFETSEVIY